MKKILGLDLGTNSIGWALIDHNFGIKEGSIIGTGSRIIPMDQKILGKFDSGITESSTANRTDYRGKRRLYQRNNLRRERLHRVLNVTGFLPDHYQRAIDFEKRLGQFKKEVKLNYRKGDDGVYRFIFMESFNEMVSDFKKTGYEIKVPHDWTIYFLRKKALTQKITKEELAWIILNFNQKRGYYQLRGEEEEQKDGKTKTFEVLEIDKLVDSGEVIKKTGDKLYDVFFKNGWKYPKQTTKPEKWLNRVKEYIVTTSTLKNGDIKRTYKEVDSETDWTAIKAKTQEAIDDSKKYVGEYIYDKLLKNPKQKINGKLVKTIERKYYRKELSAILVKQTEFHAELKDEALYNKCINELYPKNLAHRNNLKGKNFEYFFMEDIIFYQRPLKSKKSTIGGCQFETIRFKKQMINRESGKLEEEWVTRSVKAIAKSHPLYQEFRIWQFLQNLRMYELEKLVDGKTKTDVNVTDMLLSTEEEWIALFNFLYQKKEVDQGQIINYFIANKKINKKQKANFCWNYVDKKYPMAETRAQFLTRLRKVDGVDESSFLTNKIEMNLWQIVYSVKDPKEYEQALKTFATKHNLDKNSFVDSLRNFPPFSADYGAFSEKALKKILPLMRLGTYWKVDNIHPETLERIDKILTGEYDEKIKDKVREKSFYLDKIEDFQGLPLWLASYIIYDRHSEVDEVQHWRSPADIDKYLQNFKQHSLRNPIVEQIVMETLRTVRDIWQYFGAGSEKYFDEIHLELGREMKNPAAKRKQISERNMENENTNQRIKSLLQELVNNGIPNIRPSSPSQQEILKIYEAGVRENPNVRYDQLDEQSVNKIIKSQNISGNDIKKYKLWLEQGYVSPYTGKNIPLSDLFTHKYDIEHVIPQSRFFNNSLQNKVICERAVNELKSNNTAYEFIKENGGSIVDLGNGKTVRILLLENYESHCKQYFKNNRGKLNNLLAEEIPDDFVNRQLNDSRYISKFIKGLLSNIVRQEGEESATAIKLVTVSGAITSRLKKDWGLYDKWNELIAPRFKRLNGLFQNEDFGFWDKKINAFRVKVPDELSRGFNKKRIDHRHHTLDALVIAACTSEHINYLNSINSNRTNFSLVSKIRHTEKKKIFDRKTKQYIIKQVATSFRLPWEHFPVEAKANLEKVVISFKQNLRVINKTNNKTWQWRKQDNGQLKKQLIRQTKGTNWAIRKSLHQETVSGRVLLAQGKEKSIAKALERPDLIIDRTIRNIVLMMNLPNATDRIAHFKKQPIVVDGKKITKVKVFTEATAVRSNLSGIQNAKHIQKITDKGIQKILKAHLKSYLDEKGKENYAEAFSPEGIEDLNKNIKELNNGKDHKPIYSVRLFEEGKRFSLGNTGNKNTKFVQTADGTNLYLAVYLKPDGTRDFETIPFAELIEHQKQVAHLPASERTVIPINPDKGQFIFHLSPNDLVYVPTEEEKNTISSAKDFELGNEQLKRIYAVNDFSDKTIYFTPQSLASPICPKEVDLSFNEKKQKLTGSYDKKTASLDGIQIKSICWKLETDRLGNIIKLHKG